MISKSRSQLHCRAAFTSEGIFQRKSYREFSILKESHSHNCFQFKKKKKKNLFKRIALLRSKLFPTHFKKKIWHNLKQLSVSYWGFTGGPVSYNTAHFDFSGGEFYPFLVGELRSHILCHVAPQKNIFKMIRLIQK